MLGDVRDESRGPVRRVDLERVDFREVCRGAQNCLCEAGGREVRHGGSRSVASGGGEGFCSSFTKGQSSFTDHELTGVHTLPWKSKSISQRWCAPDPCRFALPWRILIYGWSDRMRVQGPDSGCDPHIHESPPKITRPINSWPSIIN